ncbi:hypothetical protein ACFV1L_13230 [Kitasatospora sp. NPDC059646]|uniref:hypothetical protein n=1 Tax=Kitasatospora sp. NPDC059646 TaxID=3346893 RepID=UPI0036BDF531
MARSGMFGLLAGGEPPAPGENLGGDGLVGLIVAVLGRVGWPVGMGVLGVLAVLAGGAWMRGRPGAEGRRR